MYSRKKGLPWPPRDALSVARDWIYWVRLRPDRPQNTGGYRSSHATFPGPRTSVRIKRWTGTCPCQCGAVVHSARCLPPHPPALVGVPAIVTDQVRTLWRNVLRVQFAGDAELRLYLTEQAILWAPARWLDLTSSQSIFASFSGDWVGAECCSPSEIGYCFRSSSSRCFISSRAVAAAFYLCSRNSDIVVRSEMEPSNFSCVSSRCRPNRLPSGQRSQFLENSATASAILTLVIRNRVQLPRRMR